MEHDDSMAAPGVPMVLGDADPSDLIDPGDSALAPAAAEPAMPDESPTDVSAPPSAADAAAAQAASEAITSLTTEMAALRRDFDTKIKYDQSKEHMLDTLHAELQTHREGLIFRVLRPVLLDLIGLYDDLANLATGSLDAPSAARSSGTVAQEGIVDILERYGANAYTADAGATVVSGRQRTINVIATDDPAQDGTVARSLRPGFEYEGRVLRPEWIEAYRYSAPQQDTTLGGDQEHV